MVTLVPEGARKKAAFLSSYLPRKCGIATFASDLIANIRLAAAEAFTPLVVALDGRTSREYEDPVRIRIRKDVRYDYLAAADYLNRANVDLVCVQHEFGLFGGDAGSYLGLLLNRLKKPVIATLHTVLERPAKEYYDSLMTVCRHAERLVVMNKRGVRMLRKNYGVPLDKIEFIPHGIPDLPFADTNRYKQRLGFAGRKTILTFGLLGRNKGIEVML
ncbi:MAG: glycosyltransferase, partial [Planctomycetota bacterium]